MRQILLESAHLKSNIAKENNNILGMKLPKQRSTLAIGESNNFAIFNSWQECIIDFRMWQERYYSNGCYYEFLDSYGYDEKQGYSSKLKQIKIRI